MPLYDYRCSHCDYTTEIEKSMDDTSKFYCECGGLLERVYNSPYCKFVGEGFHCNDYATKGEEK
jgi:putative FmdB family regulatory protein